MNKYDNTEKDIQSVIMTNVNVNQSGKVQASRGKPPPKFETAVFKTSDISQPPELKSFFTGFLRDPFNKYCIDCKKNETTHAVIWLGILVCKECAEIIKKNRIAGAGPQGKVVYIKEMRKE